jgi:hypothetical protein
MTDHTYTAPNLASLTDRSKQLDALRLLQHAAVHHYSLQKTHEKLIARTVNRKLKIETHRFRLDRPLPSLSPLLSLPLSLLLILPSSLCYSLCSL